MAVAYAPMPITTSNYQSFTTTTTSSLPFESQQVRDTLNANLHDLLKRQQLFDALRNETVVRHLQRQPPPPPQQQQLNRRQSLQNRQKQAQSREHRQWDELDNFFNRPSLKPVAPVQPAEVDIDAIHQTPVNKRNAGKSTDVFIAPPSTDGKAKQASTGKKSQQRKSQSNDENVAANANIDSRHATPAAAQSRRTSQQLKSRQATPAAKQSPAQSEASPALNNSATRSQRSSLQSQQPSANTSDDNDAVNDDTEIPMTMPRKSMMPMHPAASPISFDADDDTNADAVDSMLDEMLPSDDSNVQTPATQKKSAFVSATDVNASDDDAGDLPAQPEFEMNDNADESYENNDNDDEEKDDQERKDPTPAKKKADKPKAVRAPRVYNGERKKGRRQTFQIVEENAKMIEIVHDNVDEDTGVRRSGRSQRAPLAYWTTEHIIYKRGRSDEGMDKIMGSPEYVPPIKTPAKESTRGSKKGNKTKKQRG